MSLNQVLIARSQEEIAQLTLQKADDGSSEKIDEDILVVDSDQSDKHSIFSSDSSAGYKYSESGKLISTKAASPPSDPYLKPYISHMETLEASLDDQSAHDRDAPSFKPPGWDFHSTHPLPLLPTSKKLTRYQSSTTPYFQSSPAEQRIITSVLQKPPFPPTSAPSNPSPSLPAQHQSPSQSDAPTSPITLDKHYAELLKLQKLVETEVVSMQTGLVNLGTKLDSVDAQVQALTAGFNELQRSNMMLRELFVSAAQEQLSHFQAMYDLARCKEIGYARAPLHRTDGATFDPASWMKCLRSQIKLEEALMIANQGKAQAHQEERQSRKAALALYTENQSLTEENNELRRQLGLKRKETGASSTDPNVMIFEDREGRQAPKKARLVLHDPDLQSDSDPANEDDSAAQRLSSPAPATDSEPKKTFSVIHYDWDEYLS